MEQLTLFAEDFPVRTSASLDEAQGLKETDQASGSSLPGSSKSSSRSTRSSKTSQPFALEDWIKCSGASLRSGTMQNGIVFPLQPLALLTVGTESGSLPTHAFRMGPTQKPTHNVPTPTASDHIERASTSKEVLNPETNKSVTLDRWVKFWPTPRASEYKDCGPLGRSPTLTCSTAATYAPK